MRAVFQWSLGKRSLELGKRSLIMGIINVTPDSFSDGGLYLDAGKATAHALQLLDEGADIIDVGGESTRPGARAATVSAEEELRRVLPVITALKKQRPDAVISIDTYKASLARAAVNAGAEIVNDVSGLRWDKQMARAIAESVSETGADSLKQMGAVVKAARAKLEGKAIDGKALSDKVRETLTPKS